MRNYWGRGAGFLSDSMARKGLSEEMACGMRPK